MLAMPSPSPGAGGESPIMTWGRVDGTPVVLSRPDTYQVSYRKNY